MKDVFIISQVLKAISAADHNQYITNDHRRNHCWKRLHIEWLHNTNGTNCNCNSISRTLQVACYKSNLLVWHMLLWFFSVSYFFKELKGISRAAQHSDHFLFQHFKSQNRKVKTWKLVQTKTMSIRQNTDGTILMISQFGRTLNCRKQNPNVMLSGGARNSIHFFSVEKWNVWEMVNFFQ